MDQFYLNHGKHGEPMLTEKVPHSYKPMPHHLRGQTWTATGYGYRIPTGWKVFYQGRWRRVYCCIYGNSGTCYIGKNLAEGIRVDRDNCM